MKDLKNRNPILQNSELNMYATIIKNDKSIFDEVPTVPKLDWGINIPNVRIDIRMYFTIFEHYFLNQFSELCDIIHKVDKLNKLISSVDNIIKLNDLNRMINPILLDLNLEEYLSGYGSKIYSVYLSEYFNIDTSYYTSGTRVNIRSTRYYSGVHSSNGVAISNRLMITSAITAALEGANYHQEADKLWTVMNMSEPWWDWIINIYGHDIIESCRSISRRSNLIPWFEPMKNFLSNE